MSAEQLSTERRRARRKSRSVTVHQDDGEGNWLISYADMMTLLFGFFVMLSAFSTPNAQKFEEMRSQTAQSMGGKYTKPYEDLTNSVKKVLQEIDLEKEISVTETFEGVTITSKGTLFFESGSADLRPQAQLLMDNISSILAKQAIGFRIIVEGHTDDTPMYSTQFPSNWELSSARAGTVVRLIESKGLTRTNLRPVGLADTEPVVPNRTPAGESIPANQAENRRIVIRIQKQLPTRMTDSKAPAAPTGGSAATVGSSAPQSDDAAVPSREPAVENAAPTEAAPASNQ